MDDMDGDGDLAVFFFFSPTKMGGFREPHQKMVHGNTRNMVQLVHLRNFNEGTTSATDMGYELGNMPG